MYRLNSAPHSHAQLFDDFLRLDTAATNGQWASVNDGATGALALNASLHGGWIDVPSAAADNDYQLMATVAKLFKIQAGKSLSFEARFKLTEANTTAANFVFGLSSITTAGFLADNGGGPPASYDGVVIFKVDGGTVFQAEASKAGSQATNASLAAFTSGSIYRVGFTIDQWDGVTAHVRPWVLDETTGVQSEAGRDNYLKLPFSGLGMLYPIFGVKAGSASAETLSVDYVRVIESRS